MKRRVRGRGVFSDSTSEKEEKKEKEEGGGRKPLSYLFPTPTPVYKPQATNINND
jgi:hypothetical protein